MTDIFKTLQDNIIKLAESKETDFLPLVKSVYGDTPEAVLKGALFASYIYKKGNKEQKRILLECDGELKAKGSRKHIKKFNQMFPVVSKKKNTTKIVQSKSEDHIAIPTEIYRENLENAVKRKELELQVAHNDEKIQLYKQIDELQNKLANLPESLKKEQEKNTKLEEIVKNIDNKSAEKKFNMAVNAIQNNNLSKADEILAEIEDNEKLTKKEFGSIAYTRGSVAETDMRWHDSAKHFVRAAQIDPDFDTLIKAQALTLHIGDYDSALPLCLQAKKAAIAEHGEESDEHTISLNNLGENYRLLTQYKKAESYHIEALRIKEKIFGKNHPDTATSLDNLSTLYIIQERYEEAMLLCQRALKIRKDSFGDNHSDTANSINSLGGIYQEQGQYIKAKNLFNKALVIRKKVLAKKHPDIAQSMNNLAGSYYKQKQYKKAKPLFRQALKILESNFGHDHPRTKEAKYHYEYINNTENTPPK